MTWAYAGASKKPGRVLAWSALMAITLVLAALLQALAAGALVETTPAVTPPPSACQSASPATAALLADGDDVRARYLAKLCGTPVAPYP